jgi:hypothetical protein
MQISVIGLNIAKAGLSGPCRRSARQARCTGRLRRGQVLDYFRLLPPCLVSVVPCATAM